MQLIDAIRPVCPCKYSNIAPTPRAMVTPTYPSMMPESVLAGSQSQFPPSSQQAAFYTPTPKFAAPPTAAITSHQNIACLNDRDAEQDSDPFSRPGFSSSQLPSSQLSQRQDLLSSITCTPAPPTKPNISRTSDACLDPAAPTPLTPNRENLTHLQPPSVSRVTHPPPVSQTAEEIPTVQPNPADDMLTTICQMSDLNNLPIDKLEELVATVIREDGFTQLVSRFWCSFTLYLIVCQLEKLDNLWKIRGFLGR